MIVNKILNWTFGACFRTLGRFLAIFILGFLLIFIGSKIGFELPDWLALKVNAASPTEQWAGNIKYTIDAYNLYDLTSTGARNIDLYTYGFQRYSAEDIITIYEGAERLTIAGNGIMHAFNLSQRTQPGYLYQLTFYQCSNKKIFWENVNADIFIYQNTGVSSRPANTTLYQTTNITEITAENASYCQMFTTLFVPNSSSYVGNGSWVGLRERASGSNIPDTVVRAYGFDLVNLGIWSGSLKGVIEDSGFATAESVTQVQQSVNQVEQEIKQTQDTITNEDTTGAEDSASGFFNDFDTNTFGLTSIITAPLNAINSLISSSCSPLVLPLPFVDKNLSLPCMSSVYSQYFGGFFTLYQLITTGLISYYIIVRIFNLVKDFKNPEHDEIEVVDL